MREKEKKGRKLLFAVIQRLGSDEFGRSFFLSFFLPFRHIYLSMNLKVLGSHTIKLKPL